MVSKSTAAHEALQTSLGTTAAKDANSATRIDPRAEKLKPLWEYIRPYLARTTRIPNSAYVPELLQLPKVRDIAFSIHRKDARVDEKTNRDVAAVVIQLTGEVSAVACSSCRDKKGIFSECVVIAHNAFPDARSRYTSCANCLYHANETSCNRKQWVLDRDRPPFPQRLWVNGRRSAGPGKDQIQKTHSASPPLPTEQPDGQSAKSSPAPTYTQATAGSSREVAGGDVADVEMGTDDWASPSVEPAQSNVSTRTTRSSRRTASANPSQPAQTKPAKQSPLVSAGATQPAEILEMEKWEVAPGRIRELSAANAESKSRLESYPITKTN